MRDRPITRPLALQYLDCAQTLFGDPSPAATPAVLSTERRHPTLRAAVMIAGKPVTAPGKPVTAHCAGLVLAYSRRLFVQYYSKFTRFEAKHFLLEAARFMDGTCPLCVIDNTSVIVADGTGADAVIAPEMAAFARTLGFRFQAHAVGHADRKGRIERPFFFTSKLTFCRPAASAASRISNARRWRGAEISPIKNPNACSACRRKRPI